jgi:PAT family beta-lactamase induction signal transducer AmpG
VSHPGRGRRIGIQGPLGFASGVPLLLTGSTLVAWAENMNTGLVALGAISLVRLPYNFKFLWAPFLDRFVPPFLGRRRGWIVITQLILAPVIALMAALGASGSMHTIAMLAVMVATLSATQDIVVDAYRTDVLEDDERGKGTAAYVAGFRVGMIIAGAGALALSDLIGWTATYYIMAALVASGAIAALLAPEPPAMEPPQSIQDAVVLPLRDLFSSRAAILLLAVVLMFKLGEGMADQMLFPFLRRSLGFTNTEIALFQKLIGIAATIAGCTVGGIVLDRIGVIRGMIVFGVLQAAANVGYLILAFTGKSYVGLGTAIVIDNVCNGLGTAAFVAFLMWMCNRRFSATQYAILTSISSILSRVLGPTLGFIPQSVGWSGFFATTIAAAIPALLLLVVYQRGAEGAVPTPSEP